MRRRLFTFCSALSLLLCVAVCVLWVRSYFVSQFVGWSDPSRFVGAMSMHGLVRLEFGTYGGAKLGWSYVSWDTSGGAESSLWREVRARDRHGTSLRRLGLGYAHIENDLWGTGFRRARYYVPHWLLACLALPLPLLWLRRSLRARYRNSGGLCPTCGYDLRATPDRCPECGRAADAMNA